MMPDVVHHGREQPPERPRCGVAIEGGMADAGADREFVPSRRHTAEFRDAVDVDEVRGPRQAKRHDRNQALPAGEHAAVVGRNLGQVATVSSIVFGAW